MIIEGFNISHGIEIVPSNAPIVTTGYDEEVEEEDVLLCQKCEPNHLAHPLQDTNHHLFAIVSISLLLPSSTPMSWKQRSFLP